MTPILLAAVLAYGFNPGDKVDYTLKATFDGFVPVLGGQEGKFEVTLGFVVEGVKTAEANQVSAASEAKTFELKVNGAQLMNSVDAIKDYFPRTTVIYEKSGKIIKSDAPDLKLPVRLPGLDAKRFPDITYLPIEFPANEIAIGSQWRFEKIFDGSPIRYDCRVVKLDENRAEISIDAEQSYDALENESMEIVVKEEDAISSVKTKLSGKGTAVLDRKAGRIKSFDMNGDSVSEVTDLKTKKTTTRKLKTRLLVEEKAPLTRISGHASENRPFLERILRDINRSWDQQVQKARVGYMILKPKVEAWIRSGMSMIRI